MYNNVLSEQIKDRFRKNDQSFDEGIRHLADTVSGRRGSFESRNITGTEDIVQIKNICLYPGQKIPDSDCRAVGSWLLNAVKASVSECLKKSGFII